MAKENDPVLLELVSLPREQAGPFVLLGLDKVADREEIESHWADRLKWARKGLAKTPLEDINWAREMLREPQRRVQADAGSLNTDTSERTLYQLGRRYGVEGSLPTRTWQPLDSEKPLADYSPPAEVPDAEALRAALVLPDIPQELPAVLLLLDRLVQQPLDPWAPDLLPTGDSRLPSQDQAP
jgi:hypothetical protein